MLSAHSNKIEPGLSRWVLLTVAFLLLLPWTPARASWLIDADRVHVSVHRGISCVECHGQISATHHPDPASVNKSLGDFFALAQCAGCHAKVVQDLDKGLHAGKKVGEPGKYKVCITCHDPHYQLSAANRPPAFDPSKPVSLQCGACHAMKTALPPLSSADRQCMACHRQVERKEPGAVKQVAAFCFTCHGKNGGAPLSASRAIDSRAYQTSTHRTLSCLDCHQKSAQFGHTGQTLTGCLACHTRHDEKVTHAAHLEVACEACHLRGITPVARAGRVSWKVGAKPGDTLLIHDMSLERGESSCRRCHYKGNPVGAAAMVLPPKSILCMPCHAATFSVGDPTTVISLLLFLLGMASLGLVRLSPKTNGGATTAIPHETFEPTGRAGLSSKTVYVIKIIILDVFFQRRLFKQSKSRWFVHSLIFWPIVLRFLWGMTALLTSLWIPASSVPWIMLDCNNPLNAFLFDVSGLMILAGVIATMLRKVKARSGQIGGLPPHDWPALFLLCGLVVVGFLLEAMRMAMTGFPPGSGYGFAGYALGRLISNTANLTTIYGYVWYLHAIVTGALAVYLPFSDLLHIILAPLVLVMKGLSGAGGRG
jgi:predicted CXXCH cytochrome family protein